MRRSIKWSIQEVLNVMPSEKLQNYAFKNNGNLSFSKVMSEWGLDQNVNSNVEWLMQI
ncbi:MAG: hypothetical protein R3B93_19190 [Bacteroidia bacterium]